MGVTGKGDSPAGAVRREYYQGLLDSLNIGECRRGNGSTEDTIEIVKNNL